MKSIKFKTDEQQRTIYAVKEAIITFLNKHAKSELRSFVSLDGKEKEIVIRASCANNDYTRALALFQLIFSSDNRPAFIRYSSVSTFTVVLFPHSTYSEVVKYIEQHMNIEIQD